MVTPSPLIIYGPFSIFLQTLTNPFFFHGHKENYCPEFLSEPYTFWAGSKAVPCGLNRNAGGGIC